MKLKNRLTKKRRKWIDQERQTFGNPLVYSPVAADRYKKSLDFLINKMKKEYEREILRVYKSSGEWGKHAVTDANIAVSMKKVIGSLSKKWASIFNQNAQMVFEGFEKKLNRDNRVILAESLKKMTGGKAVDIPNTTEAMKPIITASIAENVALIKSIPQEYLKRVEGAVMRSIVNGGVGASEVMKEIEHIGASTNKRASLIARDQTKKITVAVNSERMKSVGVKKFRWVHSSGSAVPRPLHVKYNGMTFSVDDPPIIDEKTGERGMPGQLINCSCIAVPVFDFEDM